MLIATIALATLLIYVALWNIWNAIKWHGEVLIELLKQKGGERWIKR